MADKKPDTGPVMYIGPTKMGALHVAHGAVFTAGVLPEHLARAVRNKGNEALRALFVPVSEAGRARAALRDATSDMATAYRAVAAMEG
ncbi:hypothetical protein [Pseudodesulfovibrio pelocollis]|uniref:hypothetical protein n=1 Tax=Pseudodesulfovibrio pelocollis TaxID=3051432 RepID=UPI00255AE03D|nr:hypothetical protein [Pseudodesulfovibrio sp. SB368]